MWKCKTPFSICLTLLFSYWLQVPALADVLFQDDFEEDVIGDEPQKWTYDPGAEIVTVGRVDLDPLDPNNQVFTGYGGYWADNGAEYKDFVAEWDWMFVQDNGRNNSLGFRVQSPTAHYQMSRRGGGNDWKIYMFNGAWNEIVTAVFPTEIDKWYRVQLTVMGEKFVVKVKEKEDDTPFHELKPVLQVIDATHDRGKLSTSYWGPIDNVEISYPDLVVRRDIPDGLLNGQSGVVTLTVTPTVPGAVSVSENLPPTLVPSNPSHGGVITAQGVNWNLGVIDKELVLIYTMTVDPLATDAELSGEATLGGVEYPIFGDDYTGSPTTTEGYIKLWNHLGPLAWAFPARAGDHGPPGACDANGGLDLTADWIVNADLDEKSIRPFPGLVTRPKYGGDGIGTGARAAGLVIEPGDTGKVSQVRFPVWKGTHTPGSTIDHASLTVNGFDAEDHLTMSYVYVTNNTAAPISTSIGYSSDDSIQIQLNGVEVTQLSICRGWGSGDLDLGPLVTLEPGVNRLLVKVTDGCCASGFRLRFHKDPQDSTLGGLTAPELSFSLESKENPRPGDVVRSLSRDTYGQGESVEVTLTASLKAASDLVIRETLPPLTRADAFSDGGALNGGVIEWNLKQVSQKAVSYRLSGDLCAGDITFPTSAFQVGSSEVAVTGASGVRRTYRADDLGSSWTSADVGIAGGSAERLGDHEVLVNAAGQGIKLLKDEFHFISIPQNGDFTLSAAIGCLDDPGGKGSAGLTVRASRDASAANAFFGLSWPQGAASGTLKVSFRQDANKTTTQVTTIAPADRDVSQLPIHLKVTRTGSTLSFQRSSDGVSFKEIFKKEIGTAPVPVDSRPINLPAETVVGLAASGSGAGSLRADFRDVSGPPFTTVVAAGFRRGDSDGDGKVDLTDAIFVLSFQFLGGPGPQCFDAADADDSGVIDLTDAIFSLQWQFLGGPEPPPPGPKNCGADATPGDPFTACTYNC